MTEKQPLLSSSESDASEKANKVESSSDSIDSDHLKFFGEDLETKRWFILLCFFLYSGCSIFLGLGYHAIGSISTRYLQINNNQLLLLAEIFLVSGLLFSYLGVWLAKKYFRNTFVCCCLLTMIGGWVRYFAGTSFIWGCVGQAIIGIGAAPMYGLASLIPDRWFSAKERFIAITIAVNSYQLGWAFSYLVPVFVVKGQVDRVPFYVLSQAILMTLPLLIAVICVTERPRIPPSYSAMIKLLDSATFWEETKAMVKGQRFVPTVIIFGTIMGVTFGIAPISGGLGKIFLWDYVIEGMVGFCYVMCGILAGFFNTVIVTRERMPNYDQVIKILSTISLIAALLLGTLISKYGKIEVGWVIAIHCALGIGLIGGTPLLFASIVESTFPTQEAVSGNALNLVQVISFSLVGNLGTLPVFQTSGFFIVAVFLFPCWLCVLFYVKTTYKRHKADSIHPEIDHASRVSMRMIEEKEGDHVLTDMFHEFATSINVVK